MSDSLLIRNATIASSAGTSAGDVLIRDGRIAAVGPALDAEAATTIDADGLTLLPGVLDPQVHFRDPGLEWKEDLEPGSRACAAGGVTGFFDMPNTVPNTVDREIMAAKKELAARKCLVNYNFFIGATPDNLEEVNAVENVPGIKIFMAASTGSLLVSDHDAIENIFAHGDRLIAIHSEDEATLQANRATYAGSTDVQDHMRIRSPEAALRSTQFIVSLSRKYNRRLHILHLTTKDEVDFLRSEKVPGLISTELCPQHFLLRAPDDYERLGTYVQMNPPVRDAVHADALWEGLQDGTIDCMATDHAPHTHAEKQQPFGQAPAGMPGVETLLPLMLDQVNRGRCSIEQVVRWLCESPCELYKVPNKGRVAVGYDADLVLIDMHASRTIRNGSLQTKSNWSPYDGWTTQGWPITTIVGGHVVFDNGDFPSDAVGREILIDDIR